MQVSIDITRTVRQHGESLGGLGGCVIEEVTDDEYANLLTALATAQHGVTLSEEHAPTPNEPSAAYLAAQQAETDAKAQREADLALLAASSDPHHQALARLLA